MARRPVGLTLEEAFKWFMPGEPPEHGCWEWTGTVFPGSGYGMLKHEGKCLLAHRVSYQLFRGIIPAGLVVRHTPVVCDNPPCVSPGHLTPGTVQDNYHDMILSGNQVLGEQHPNAIFTEEIVRTIRERVVAGESRRAMAREYGASRYAVYSVMTRKTWAHVV